MNWNSRSRKGKGACNGIYLCTKLNNRQKTATKQQKQQQHQNALKEHLFALVMQIWPIIVEILPISQRISNSIQLTVN